MATVTETGSSDSADTVEQKILKALRSGDYTVTYMAPKNISPMLKKQTTQLDLQNC